MYQIAVAVLRLLCRILLRLEIKGKENIPAGGPLLVVFNHRGNLDGALVTALLYPLRVVGFAAHLHRWNVFLILASRLGSVILVRRGKVHRQSLDKAVAVLTGGGILMIAPEGRRSRTGVLEKGKGGVAYITDRASKALEAEIPILPIGLAGTKFGELFSHWRCLQRALVKIQIGEPFFLEGELPEKGWPRGARGMVWEQIMPRIKKLLPESLHGVYAD